MVGAKTFCLGRLRFAGSEGRDFAAAGMGEPGALVSQPAGADHADMIRRLDAERRARRPAGLDSPRVKLQPPNASEQPQ